jgi:hypothetical protein
MPTKKSKVAKPKPVEPPVPAISKFPVSLGLAVKLRDLDRAMTTEFGADMAYVIMGNGKIIAASDALHGHMLADVKDERDARIYTLAEIWQCPNGTKILHPDLGVGVVTAEGKDSNPELDATVVTFEGGKCFVVPAPPFVASPPPWNVPAKMLRPKGATVNTAYTSA